MNKNTNKNTLKKALNDIKTMVFGSVKSKSSKVKFRFEIVEDTEGQTIHYPVLEVGAPVTIGDSADGDVAPDGWYQLEDGVEIRVEGGVIAEISQPEIAEDFEEENPEAKSEDVSEKVIEVVEDAIAQIEDLQTKVEAVETAQTEVEDLKNEIQALTDAVVKLSKEPISKSVTKTESFSASNGGNEKLKNLAGILSKK